MRSLALIAATLLATPSAMLAQSPDDGVCNIRECGCPPYKQPWCDKRNSEVASFICQISEGFCRSTCGEVWCGGTPPPSPTPPPPPPPPLKNYHLMSQNVSVAKVCYQTNYTDAHYADVGYVDGFCPFQLVDQVDNFEICDQHSDENTKYCPGSRINITVFKMGKA